MRTSGLPPPYGPVKLPRPVRELPGDREQKRRLARLDVVALDRHDEPREERAGASTRAVVTQAESQKRDCGE